MSVYSLDPPPVATSNSPARLDVSADDDTGTASFTFAERRGVRSLKSRRQVI
jgi:hypothetical protein